MSFLFQLYSLHETTIFVLPAYSEKWLDISQDIFSPVITTMIVFNLFYQWAKWQLLRMKGVFNPLTAGAAYIRIFIFY